MKMKRDTLTGIVGLVGSAIWWYLIQVQTKQPKKLLEPGPRLLPYVAFFIVAFSSVMLIIKGINDWRKDPTPDKPYFPKGGKLKVARSYLMLVIYGIALNFFGFILTTPFACFAFINDLKGQAKVKPLTAAIVAVLVTAGLYCMFVFGFQVKLPTGILFE